MSATPDYCAPGVADVWFNRGIGSKSVGLMANLKGNILYADGIGIDRWYSSSADQTYTMFLTVGNHVCETLGIGYHRAKLVDDGFGQLVRVPS